MPQTQKKFFLTQEGHEHLESEYNKLIKVQRPAIIERIQRAREFGDLAENSEYDAAKEEQSLLEARIQELEKVLTHSQLAETRIKSDFVTLGSTVVVEVDTEKEEFMIVGTIEADPSKKKISSESPVGASLMGAQVGDEVEVATPLVRAKYKILEIK